MSEIGVAVVGTSFGCLTHVRAFRAAGFEVRALVGRNAERTSSRAARFEVPYATTSLADVLSRPGVDAVTIATPPHTHGPLVREALAAGKHVVCEKPFARDQAEALELLGAARAAGVIHLLGTEFRWATGQALMRRAIAAGAIGQPKLATFLLHIPLLADSAGEVPDWWSDRDAGGGWLGAHGSHVIDQIRTTLGEFEGVSASLPVVSDRPWTAEDSYIVHFQLRSGVVGTLQSTAADWGPITIISRVAGADGTVWTEGDTVKLADKGGTRTIDVPPDLAGPPPSPPPSDLLTSAYDLLHSTGIDVGPYTRLAETFRDLILGHPVSDDPPPATFADGVAGMAVIDAIRRSARSRSWETI